MPPRGMTERVWWTVPCLRGSTIVWRVMGEGVGEDTRHVLILIWSEGRTYITVQLK